ncbi:hypothetical protein [Micromonospora sp. NPDC023814]|uniref:hypothetical protein n=1 Tax=Micromonospora sp. NPDC023814 TaxID=3154596 RepID=UPI00340AD441
MHPRQGHPSKDVADVRPAGRLDRSRAAWVLGIAGFLLARDAAVRLGLFDTWLRW